MSESLFSKFVLVLMVHNVLHNAEMYNDATSLVKRKFFCIITIHVFNDSIYITFKLFVSENMRARIYFRFRACNFDQIIGIRFYCFLTFLTIKMFIVKGIKLW